MIPSPKLAPIFVSQALEHIAYYLVLAPHDNEQSDMLHRVFRYPAIDKLELTRCEIMF